MNLRIFESAEDLTNACAATIVDRAERVARQNAGRRFAIALSGGTSPIPLYTLLGQSPMRERLAALPIDWIVVDERYVPETDPQSNSGMIRRTLFADGMSPDHRFLPFRTELGDPAATAADFEQRWRELGIEKLDIILLGTAEDGHTASLFPGTPAIEVENRIATDVFVPRLNAWRVTLTLPVIREGGLRIVIAPGESKREIVRAVREGGDFPVTRATAGVESWWFVDRAAT